MDIQQRRPQRGGEQPFDQRFLLFAMIALVAVMMLNRNPPPDVARSWAVSAEDAWPRCSGPVGDGAKRVITGV